jgi:hypothetical protein
MDVATTTTAPLVDIEHLSHIYRQRAGATTRCSTT